MVIAATLSMIIIVTFRIPYGAIGVNCAFILSRENLTSTAKSGFYFILAFAVWAALIPVGARMFASIPITHFLWEGVTAFLCFFLLKTLTNFPLATGVVVVATGTLAIWYLPGPAELNVELTLWQMLATAIGALITFLVEVVFRSLNPSDPLKDGIEDRLLSVEAMLRACGKGETVSGTVATKLTQYALTGTGTLREQITRNHSTIAQREKMSALVSLVSRAIDLSTAVAASPQELETAVRSLADELAVRISAIREAIRTGFVVSDKSCMRPVEVLPSWLSDLEATIGAMEHVLMACHVTDHRLIEFDEAGTENRIFVKDAFTNAEYVKYALAGTAASMLCYVVYVALNWPGLSTAVTTCVLTALSNIGSSRQKQLLRIVGASIGGFVLGLGSQMFVLPYIDSIVGLTMLFAFVTGVSAYVATSSPRLSYVGLQMAFAFYLINVTDFSISLDLTIARDRAVGVLLGIGAMWLVFERLYSRPAVIEMIMGFIRATRLIASLTAVHEYKAGSEEWQRIQTIRNAASGLLTNINSDADAIPFEGGTERQIRLAARDRVRRWLSSLRTVYLLEIPLAQANIDKDVELSSGGYLEVDERFNRALSVALSRIARCLENQLDKATRDQLNHRMASEAQVPAGRSESLATLIRNGDVEPSLQPLANIVEELERDVLNEPVFAP
jgi:multidrug resistance protein MdtO